MEPPARAPLLPRALPPALRRPAPDDRGATRLRASAAVAALALALVSGCAPERQSARAEPRPPAGAAPGSSAPPTAPEPASLPDDWARRDLGSFEAWITAVPAEAGIALDHGELRALRQALDTQELVAVRAALVLARSRDPRAPGVLLARLEERARPAERHADAGDVVAAAALIEGDDSGDRTARLAALAIGERPHPDLEIRVECAASALARGRDDVVPFLLAVLRHGTPAGRQDAIDWPPQEALSWAKSRAARALHARLGHTNTFEPDASYADQERHAAELADALRAAGVAVPEPF